MSLILDGTNGVSDINGSAATPAIRGADANTGIFFPAVDTIAFAEDGVEVMRIDSSGNVGIGTSSPNVQLALVGSTNEVSASIRLNNTGAGGNNYLITSRNDGSLRFTNDTAAAERMRIDSSGNLNIGGTLGLGKVYSQTSAAGYAYYAYGNFSNGAEGGLYAGSGYLGLNAVSAHDLRFATSNTERMRIDSSGDYLFLGGTLRIKNAANNTQYGAIYANSSEFHVNAGVDNLVFTTAGGECARFTAAREFLVRGTTDQGAYNIQCNGTGVWGAGAYVNGSDERIKDDIQSIESGLDVVEKLNPVTYRYKEEWSSDQSVQTGFIAQELLVALEGKNYVDGIVQQGGAKNYYSVAYQNIIPILTKAIQELKAELDATKAEVAAMKALNGN